MFAGRRIKRIHFLLLVLGICVFAFPFRSRLRLFFVAIIQILRGKKTVAQRVRQYQDDVMFRLNPLFAQINVDSSPKRMLLVALKQERMLEVWVTDGHPSLKRLNTYPVLAASGTLGPKLREGDAQVPEGFYKVDSLNPNSLYHLALRLNFPNEFDREMARLDGRENVGSDIMIHGKDCSVGCLAMGDPAVEDPFVLSARTGIENISVIISPVDFRVRDLPPDMPPVPDWIFSLYNDIKVELAKLIEGIKPI